MSKEVWRPVAPLLAREREVIAETPLELAITSARAEVAHPAKLITPDDVAVEIRGAGNLLGAEQHGHIADAELVFELVTLSERAQRDTGPTCKRDAEQRRHEAQHELLGREVEDARLVGHRLARNGVGVAFALAWIVYCARILWRGTYRRKSDSTTAAAMVFGFTIVLWMTEALPLAVTAMLGPTLAVLLGMNAHINRDLPFVLWEIGLVKADGTSLPARILHRLPRGGAAGPRVPRAAGRIRPSPPSRSPRLPAPRD